MARRARLHRHLRHQGYLPVDGRPADQPVYDEALFERHWAALQALYAERLA
jgi:hypothetical protein